MIMLNKTDPDKLVVKSISKTWFAVDGKDHYEKNCVDHSPNERQYPDDHDEQNVVPMWTKQERCMTSSI